MEYKQKKAVAIQVKGGQPPLIYTYVKPTNKWQIKEKKTETVANVIQLKNKIKEKL